MPCRSASAASAASGVSRERGRGGEVEPLELGCDRGDIFGQDR